MIVPKKHQETDAMSGSLAVVNGLYSNVFQKQIKKKRRYEMPAFFRRDNK